jgi:hypothetical protein
MKVGGCNQLIPWCCKIEVVGLGLVPDRNVWMVWLRFHQAMPKLCLEDEKSCKRGLSTYETITRADLRALTTAGCLAARGVPARDVRASRRGGGGTKSGTGEDDNGVGMSSSASSISSNRRLRLLPFGSSSEREPGARVVDASVPRGACTGCA